MLLAQATHSAGLAPVSDLCLPQVADAQGVQAVLIQRVGIKQTALVMRQMRIPHACWILCAASQHFSMRAGAWVQVSVLAGLPEAFGC